MLIGQAPRHAHPVFPASKFKFKQYSTYEGSLPANVMGNPCCLRGFTAGRIPVLSSRRLRASRELARGFLI